MMFIAGAADAALEEFIAGAADFRNCSPERRQRTPAAVTRARGHALTSSKRSRRKTDPKMAGRLHY